MDVVMSMLEDLADLFEQAAADGTPIRAVVGGGSVGFAETFLRSRTVSGSTKSGSGRLVPSSASATEIEREINRSGAVGQCHRARRSKRWGDEVPRPDTGSATP